VYVCLHAVKNKALQPVHTYSRHGRL